MKQAETVSGIRCNKRIEMLQAGCGKRRLWSSMHRCGLIGIWILAIGAALSVAPVRSYGQQLLDDPRLLGDPKLPLWPGDAPGWETDETERDMTNDQTGRKVAGRRVMRLGNVSQPSIALFRPAEDKNTGAAVIVCPGGGYRILAYDLEGTEVCQWLQSIGVTGVLLKYRVPRRDNERLPVEPLMDAQRAISLVRSRASQWNIDPNRIGILGFSAGGNLAARAATTFSERQYEPVDSVDSVSCRPDFAVLVYPAYLFERGSDQWVAANLPVSKETPPMFMTMAFDDRVGPENILRMGLALKEHEVPCEIHLYPTGGHGYGLRRTEHFATTWPDRCGEWMQAMGFIQVKRQANSE